jgi:hypothetical protein
MTTKEAYEKYLALVEKLKELQEQEWKLKREIYQLVKLIKESQK